MTDEREIHKKYFDLICNKDDWRGPIYAKIPKDSYEKMAAACIFFTATPLEIESEGKDFYFVRAIGYRNGPAGP